MRRVLILLTIVLNTLPGLSADAQDNVDLKKMVGFGCYYEGEPTKTVKKMTRLLNEKAYKDIAGLLKSKNEGERYLAIISLQRLSDLGLYQLTTIDIDLLDKAKGSEELVSVCSGCTYFDKVALKTILSAENFIGSRYWLDRTIKPQ